MHGYLEPSHLIRRRDTHFRHSAFNFSSSLIQFRCYHRTLFGVETPTFDIVHSILAVHSFNLDVNALVDKVHTNSAKRKTISAESIQFRKWLIGFCKRFPSSRLPSLGRLLSRLPCDSPWVFPDRPNFHFKQTCDPVSNQRRFPNSGGQLQVKVGSGQRCLCGA